MEGYMNTEQNTQDTGNEAGTQGTTSEEKEKLFTQEEVNGFIQSRLSRLRGQINKEVRAEYDQKFSDLTARENRLMVKEALSNRGMPRELADIITCTDEEDLSSKLDALQKIYGDKPKEEKKPGGFTQIGVDYRPHAGGIPQPADPVRDAMGLKR